MTREQLERWALRFEELGDWTFAREVRVAKCPGRPKKRVNGVTPKQAATLDFRKEIIAAGGDLGRFKNDPRIPSTHTTWEQQSEYLRKILTFEGRDDLRKASKNLR